MNTLADIALRLGVTVGELMEINGIDDPDVIIAGRVLTLPSGTRTAGGGNTGKTPFVGQTQGNDEVGVMEAQMEKTISDIMRTMGVSQEDAVALYHLGVAEGEEPKNINPSKNSINNVLEGLSKKYNVPLKTLKALIATESSYRQYKSNGNVLRPYKPGTDGELASSAVGLTQITKDTANRYGFDYERLINDWEYNLKSGVKIYSDNYQHKWNRNISDIRIRSARAYGLYHDGFKDTKAYGFHSGLLNSAAENNFFKNY